MKVLGIDPGVGTTGFAIVRRSRSTGLRGVAAGVIRTAARRPQAARLAELHVRLAELIAEHRPEVMAIEKVFFNANVRTAMAVGQASGVALLTAAESGLEVFDYTPTEVKSSVVGVGDATKRQVQAMVASLLGLQAPPSSPDAADACALAICHINRAGLVRALGASGAAG